MKQIEIIFVDDCSTDNSVIVIQKEMIKDSRITLYKNKKNMGNMYTKSIGAKNAKGKYIISLDSDDLLLPDDLLSTVYEEAIENNIDITQFESFSLNKYEITKKMFIKKKNWSSTQPEISRFFSQRSEYHRITAKLIKTHIYKKALELMGEEIKFKINWYDDNLIMSLIYSLSSSFKHINKYGYLVYDQKDSSRKKGRVTFCFDSLIYIFLLFNHAKLNDNFFDEIKFILWRWNDKKCMRKSINITKDMSKVNLTRLLMDKHFNATHKKTLKIMIKKLGNKT